MLNKKGFTLIELLIVIVIIGLLAAVVIAAINPVESRNRAVDTGLKSDAGQLYNAIERHYASKGYFPWQAAATDTTSLGTGGVAALGTTWMTALSTTSEIKPEFVARPNLANIRVYQSATNSVSVCFTPTSQNFIALRNGDADGARVTVGSGTQVCLPE